MDWANVFDDDAEEEGYWDRTRTDTRLGNIISKLQTQGQYTPFICYAFTVNYVCGVGCLGIPHAFYQAGIVLGVLMIIGMSVLSYWTTSWIAQSTARAVTLSEKDESFAKLRSENAAAQESAKKAPSAERANRARSDSIEEGKESISSNVESYPLPETVPLVSVKNYGTNGTPETISSSLRETPEKKDSELNSTEPEVTELCGLFLGENARIIYQLSLMMLTFIGLLAYAQVFTQSFQQQIWPSGPRWVGIAVFAVLAVPLTCCDLTEQITVQLIMSLLRFVSLAILGTGSLAALWVDRGDSQAAISEPAMDPPFLAQNLPLVTLAGLPAMLCTSIFSQLFQHSVPGLVRPLSQTDKAKVPAIFATALTTTATIYILIGIISVLYFGQNIQQSVNLNFVNFYWGWESDGGFTTILLGALSTVVVLFPAIDTLSVFPLIAITLANSLALFFPQPRHWQKGLLVRLLPRPKSGWPSSSRITTIFWRLVASIPPLLLGGLATDLALSLQLAGFCGILVALVFPALLQWSSLARFQEAEQFSPGMRHYLGAPEPFRLRSNAESTTLDRHKIDAGNVFGTRARHFGYICVVLSVAALAVVVTLCQTFGWL
jgi:amino acid permease